MAKLYFTLRPTKQTVKKTYKIYLAICHKRKVCYISSEYEVKDLYQFDKGRVVCRKDAKIMNQRLNYLLFVYQEMLDSLSEIDAYTCSQIKEFLQEKKQEVS